MTRWVRVMGATLALSLISPALKAGPTGELDPVLRQELTTAMAQPWDFNDRYIAEVWLTDMSARMRRYIPDDAQRIEFLRTVHEEAVRAGVSPHLVLAVIEIESRFNRFAISRSGATGYMQIMPFWLSEIGGRSDNLAHMRTNLRMGCTILHFYLSQSHDNWVQALARYNGSAGSPDYPYKVLTALNRHWAPG